MFLFFFINSPYTSHSKDTNVRLVAVIRVPTTAAADASPATRQGGGRVVIGRSAIHHLPPGLFFFFLFYSVYIYNNMSKTHTIL